MAKDSFILYKQHFKNINLLSMEERGQLLTAILCHVNEEEPPAMSTATKMLLPFITEQLERDAIKYAEKCERYEKLGEYGKFGKDFGILGKEYGKLGGRPKKPSLESYEDIIKNSKLSLNVQHLLWDFVRTCQLNVRAIKNKELISFIDDVKKREEEQQGIFIWGKLDTGKYKDYLKDE